MTNNSRSRALRSIQRWTVGGLLIAALATVGTGVGLAAGQQVTQQTVVSTGGQGFSKSSAPQNAPQQSQPQVTTKGS